MVLPALFKVNHQRDPFNKVALNRNTRDTRLCSRSDGGVFGDAVLESRDRVELTSPRDAPTRGLAFQTAALCVSPACGGLPGTALGTVSAAGRCL